MWTLLGGKTMIYAVLLAVCLFCAWRMLALVRKMTAPPSPPDSTKYVVDHVTNGATIEVKGRRGRTATVTLAGIASPVDEPAASDSRANLERLAGKTIRVETERHGLFRSTPEDDIAQDSQRRLDDEAQEAAETPDYEARGPIVGTVFGESGGCLQLGQIMEGYATALPSAPKLWVKEEAKAKKAKVGMWGPKK